MTRLKVDPTPLEKISADAIAVFIFEGDKDDSRYRAIDKKLGGRISSLLKKKKFSGKKLESRQVDSFGKLPAETVVVVGLGKKNGFSSEVLRQAAAKAASAAVSTGAETVALSIEGLSDIPVDELAQAAAEGVILSQYRFTQYRKKGNSAKKRLDKGIFSQLKDAAKVRKAVLTAENICRGVELARDLQNHPGNVATPSWIARQARINLQKVGVRCRVLGKREILKLKMGSFWSVAKGSAQEPKFLIMEYMKGPKTQKPVVLVGKGVTFDTGGISIKPSAGMDQMKFDMSGGAAVIGAFYTAGLLKLKKNMAGLVPLTENMPGGKANKPGDIVKASDGQTIEVLNTDAEGRLILADALVYAKKYKPSKVIDLATLTGAMMVALGRHATGLFSNDQKLAESVLESGSRTGERCWQFPLWEEYEELIKSKVADMQNIGGRWGGSITAAAFLKRFTDYPWVHLDIAGTADNEKPITPYNAPGGTGIGVRLLVDFLRRNR
jgi:leucyl aminopeptidase